MILLKYRALAVATAIFLASGAAEAKLNVVTSETNLRAIAAEVGGGFVYVDSVARGTQDPHYVEAKPSFMVKVSRADLVVAIGLELEIGWLPSILQGARNPKVMRGQPGFLEVGPLVTPLEVAIGKITRAEGDVHPDGNPHVTLDPIRAGEIGEKIAVRLGELDTEHAASYQANAKALAKRLGDKAKAWQARIEKSGVRQVITYHKTLTYFLDRFHLENPAILEPKPGIPPTSGHILGVVQMIRAQKIPLVLVENYFDPTVTKRIQAEVPSVRSITVAVAVDGAPEIKTIDDLYEGLVKAVEGK